MQTFPTRRDFLRMSAVAAGAAPFLLRSASAHATPLNLPIGIQAYTVGAEMNKDAAGTLRKVAQVGYKEVEISPMSTIPNKDLRKALDDNGLKSPSGHHMIPDLMTKLQEHIDSAHELGQQYMVITVPWVADPSRFKSDSKDQGASFLAVLNNLTLDDWKWTAEQLNKIGEQVKKAGLQLGYHNHNIDFHPHGSTTGYDELIRLTDAELVKLELDCGWMALAGHSPAEYIARHPDRYRMLHIKDFKKPAAPITVLGGHGADAPAPTELGRGFVDYAPIFAAAKKGHIAHYFVEQEPPFTEMPATEAIQVDYDYLARLKA